MFIQIYDIFKKEPIVFFLVHLFFSSCLLNSFSRSHHTTTTTTFVFRNNHHDVRIDDHGATNSCCVLAGRLATPQV